MSGSLDFTGEKFETILQKAGELVVAQYQDIDAMKGFHSNPQPVIESWFDEPLPLLEMDSLQLLDEIKQKVIDSATGNMGTNMYAYVMSGGNQISTIADLIMTTVNQNNTKWHLAPAMTEIEKRVVKWAAQIINFSPDAGGAMVSGGSEASLAGLTIARNVFFKKFDIQRNGLFGQRPFTIYCSRETHNSIDKSVSLLGIGITNLRKIETNPDFTINLNHLEEQIIEDIRLGNTPFCIVGNAGTVNTGAIDDLSALFAMAKKYKMWFHVDGAYGGLASSLPSVKEKYAGLELADSVALDFHKWLYQPFEVGCVLVRDWSLLRDTYYQPADYLDTKPGMKTDRFEFNEHYFQLSRNAKAFKVWMSLKVYGFTKIQQMIQKDIDLTRYLEMLIIQSDDFELKSKSDLAIACFLYKGNFKTKDEILAFNQKLILALEKDGRVFITGTKLNNEFALRACLINHRKQKKSVDYLLETIRDVAKNISIQ